MSGLHFILLLWKTSLACGDVAITSGTWRGIKRLSSIDVRSSATLHRVGATEALFGIQFGFCVQTVFYFSETLVAKVPPTLHLGESSGCCSGERGRHSELAACKRSSGLTFV